MQCPLGTASNGKFDNLKRGANGVNIFTKEELDAAYTKDNGCYIYLKRMAPEK